MSILNLNNPRLSLMTGLVHALLQIYYFLCNDLAVIAVLLTIHLNLKATKLLSLLFFWIKI
ncbi:hypothetical protein AR687_04840 [Flavobacteriaceae bacterium CRH]|nr:hypothetical protein AR687_04840 [Flavobacteriaceae bacterium CRH]